MSLNISELYVIIQSMTPNQKANFTKYCKVNRSSSNSLILFNALNKLQEYDEEKLIKYLLKKKKNKLVDNLPTQTILLYKLILRIMRFVTDEKNMDDKLWNTFKDAIFLQDQGFSLRPQRMLKKLKKDAIEYDMKTLQWEVYKYERKGAINKSGINSLDSVLEINNRGKALVKAMLLEEELRGIYKQIFYLSRNISAIKKDTVKMILLDVETALNEIDKNQCNCFHTKIYYLGSMMKLYELKSDKEAVFRCIEEMDQVYKVHENASKVSYFKYSNFLSNYLYCLIEYDMPSNQVEKILTKIKSIEPNTLSEEIVQFSNVYHYELFYYLKQGAFEKIEQLIPTLLEEFEKYDDKIELGRKIVMYYNLMIYYFIVADFDSSYVWLQKILDHGKKSGRIEFYHNSQFFELLLHYEFGNTQYLKSLVEKIKRNFKKVEDSKEFVDLIANLMNAHYKMPLVKKDFELALKKFDKIDKTKNGTFPFDEIKIWLRSKVEKKTMLGIAEEMLQNKV